MLSNLLQQPKRCSFVLIKNKATNKTNKVIKTINKKCSKENFHVKHEDKTKKNEVV